MRGPIGCGCFYFFRLENVAIENPRHRGDDENL